MLDLLLTRAKGAPLAVERQGETLILNGQAVDLSAVPEGGVLEHGGILDDAGVVCPWINGAVTREGGRLRVPLIAPYAGDLPEADWHPAPILDPPDGPVALPAWEASDV